MVVQEALHAAWGLAPYANENEIFLIRNLKNNKKKTIAINLEKNPQDADQIQLQARDIIVVNASSWGKFLHGMGYNIGIPGFGVSYRDPER
jgi:hypothetical protein